MLLLLVRWLIVDGKNLDHPPIFSLQKRLWRKFKRWWRNGKFNISIHRHKNWLKWLVPTSFSTSLHANISTLLPSNNCGHLLWKALMQESGIPRISGHEFQGARNRASLRVKLLRDISTISSSLKNFRRKCHNRSPHAGSLFLLPLLWKWWEINRRWVEETSH